MLELGIYVAAADGTVEDGEVDQVARFIESQFMLGPPAVRRLEALSAYSRCGGRRWPGWASACKPP